MADKYRIGDVLWRIRDWYPNGIRTFKVEKYIIETIITDGEETFVAETIGNHKWKRVNMDFCFDTENEAETFVKNHPPGSTTISIE